MNNQLLNRNIINMENEKLLRYLTEKKEEAQITHEKYKKLAPNSYGTGVEYGEMSAYNDIIKYIKKL